jgi:hypothetical protein
MTDNKKVRELMVDVFEYPHLPYWFTIKQAIGVVQKTLVKTETCVHPRIVLVFDEKYNLIGILIVRGILQGLEPRTERASDAKEDGAGIDDLAVSRYEKSLYSEETKKLLEKPISDFMAPIKLFLDPDDSVVKAALMMLRDDLQFLPVLENKEKLIGIVRIPEIFGEVFTRVLKTA